MKSMTILLFSVVILLAMSGFVNGEDTSPVNTGQMTNVYFCKMIKVGNTYEFQPLLTYYTGENDYGRLTFIAGAENLAGDYAIVQNTSKGLQLIQSFAIEPSGSATPEYVLLNLELWKDELPIPLEIINGPTTPATPVLNATTVASAITTAAPQIATSAATTAVPTTTKSPLNPIIILLGTGIAGIVCATRMHK